MAEDGSTPGICPNCGARVFEGATRCIHCGKYLKARKKWVKAKRRSRSTWPKALFITLALILIPALAISLPISIPERTRQTDERKVKDEKQTFVDSVDRIVRRYRRAGEFAASDYLELVLSPEQSCDVYASGESYSHAYKTGEYLKDAYLDAARESAHLEAPDRDAEKIKQSLEDYCGARAGEISDILEFSLSIVNMPADARTAALEQRIMEMGGTGYSFEKSNIVKNSLFDELETYIEKHGLKAGSEYNVYAEDVY